MLMMMETWQCSRNLGRCRSRNPPIVENRLFRGLRSIGNEPELGYNFDFLSNVNNAPWIQVNESHVYQKGNVEKSFLGSTVRVKRVAACQKRDSDILPFAFHIVRVCLAITFKVFEM